MSVLENECNKENVSLNNIIIDRMSALKSIKKHCKETCCCGDEKSWKNCTIKKCYLHQYRLGHNPARKGKGGNSEALKKYRESKEEELL